MKLSLCLLLFCTAFASSHLLKRIRDRIAWRHATAYGDSPCNDCGDCGYNPCGGGGVVVKKVVVEKPHVVYVERPRPKPKVIYVSRPEPEPEPVHVYVPPKRVHKTVIHKTVVVRPEPIPEPEPVVVVQKPRRCHSCNSGSPGGGFFGLTVGGGPLVDISIQKHREVVIPSSGCRTCGSGGYDKKK